MLEVGKFKHCMSLLKTQKKNCQLSYKTLDK